MNNNNMNNNMNNEEMVVTNGNQVAGALVANMIRNAQNDAVENGASAEIKNGITATVKENVTSKLAETGIELPAEAIDGLVGFLIQNQIMEIKRLKDLGNFFHENVEEENKPMKSLLVNSLLVYIRERHETKRTHIDQYYSYLEEEDLDEYDLPYEEYLSEKGLENEVSDTVYYTLRGEKLGPVYFNLNNTLQRMEKDILFYREAVAGLKDTVADFLPVR